MISWVKTIMAGGGSAEPIGVHNLAILFGSVIVLAVVTILINRLIEVGKFSIEGSMLLLFFIFVVGVGILFWGYWQGKQIEIYSGNSDVMEAEIIE